MRIQQAHGLREMQLYAEFEQRLVKCHTISTRRESHPTRVATQEETAPNSEVLTCQRNKWKSLDNEYKGSKNSKRKVRGNNDVESQAGRQLCQEYRQTRKPEDLLDVLPIWRPGCRLPSAIASSVALRITAFPILD